MAIVTEPLGRCGAKLIRRQRREDILELPTAEIQDLFKQAGVLIFRGFDVRNPGLMKAFADRFSSKFNRDRLRPPVEGTDGLVQLVTEGMGYVEPHCEQANSPFRPDAVWFCCARPANEGGETLYWDGARVLAALRPELKQLFRTKKLRFFQCYSPEKWRLFLGRGSTIEDALHALEGREGVSYHVRSDQSIYLEYLCRAVVRTKYGDQEAFSNSLVSEWHNTLGELMSFDDGEPITADIIEEIRRAMQGLTEEISWQPGDLAFIDNWRFLHGRNSFKDKERQIFSSLSFLNF